MNQYLFKQATVLCGQEFQLGMHEVSEKVECDPRFLRYVEAGLIVDAEDAKKISAETPHERAQRLHSRLTGKVSSVDLGSEKDTGPAGAPFKVDHVSEADQLHDAKNGSGVEASTGKKLESGDASPGHAKVNEKEKPDKDKPFSEADLSKAKPTNPPKEGEKEESPMEKLKAKSAGQAQAVEKLQEEDKKAAHQEEDKNFHAEAVRQAKADEKNSKVVDKPGK